MNYVEKCPRCGGTVVEKEVTELLYGGVDTAFLSIKAGVCLLCGERLYTPETVRQLEAIEHQLKHHETTGLQPLGRSFQVIAAA